MTDIAYVVVEETYLMKGSLGAEVRCLVWSEGDRWGEFALPLCEVLSSFRARVVSDLEAEMFVRSRCAAA